MPEPEETAKNLRTHLAAQDTAELYAFFLLSLEQKGMEKENAQDLPEAVLRRAEEVLRRFFRVSDTMGYLGENHFGILIPGKMAESVMEEKAAALVHALQAAFQEFPALGLTAFVGVYVFPGQAESFESMLEEAEYALLQARREEKRQYHIYTKPGSRLPEEWNAWESSGQAAGAERLKSQLAEEREWMRFLLKQSDYVLWEADLKTRQYRMLYTGDMLSGRQAVYENFPESLIENGRIHRDSAERFRKFVQGMYQGRLEDSGNFMMQYRQTSCYGWASLSYHTLFDSQGHPSRVIGMKEELSYLPRQQRQFLQRRIMPPNLYPHLYCFLQANLTTDQVEKLQLEGREQIRLIRYQKYTELIGQGLGSLFFREDVAKAQKRFGRERLLEEFQEGRRWFLERYRLADQNGILRTVACGVNLSQDPETGDVCLFAYLCNMEQRIRWEKEWKHAAHMSTAGVYTQETAEALADARIRGGGGSLSALAVFRAAGFQELFPKAEGKGRWRSRTMKGAAGAKKKRRWKARQPGGSTPSRWNWPIC